MPRTYEPIASITATAGATALTFSNIPQTFTDLILVCGGAGDAGSGKFFFLRPNNDSSALYSRTNLDGNGSSAASSRFSSEQSTFPSLANPSVTVFQIMSYANTNVFKTMLEASRSFLSPNDLVRRAVYLYRSTNAVTALNIYSSNVSGISAGTTFSLYGIKAA
jgi:hypothetical protein